MGTTYKFDIAGTEYGMEDVLSASIESPMFSDFSVGNACASELDITFWPKGTVPKMAKITPYSMQSDGSWLKLGVFFTDTRSTETGTFGETISITAFDSMLKADVEWVPSQNMEFPTQMSSAVNAIAEEMGVSVDGRTVLNSSYTVDYPANGYTMRDVLCYIAAAHAGNWIITREGKLLLVPLFGSMPNETSLLVSEDGDAITFGDVRIVV